MNFYFPKSFRKRHRITDALTFGKEKRKIEEEEEEEEEEKEGEEKGNLSFVEAISGKANKTRECHPVNLSKTWAPPLFR